MELYNQLRRIYYRDLGARQNPAKYGKLASIALHWGEINPKNMADYVFAYRDSRVEWSGVETTTSMQVQVQVQVQPSLENK